MINFTNRSYDAIRRDLITQLQSMTDVWNDSNESDASMIFINTLAGISAMLNFYIDKQCNESYINLAREDKNVISLLELLNYKRPLRVPARATQVFEKISYEASSTGSSNSIRVELPKYTALSSGSSEIPFMLGESLVMTEADTSKEVLILQGSRETYTFNKSDIIGYKLYLPQGGISEEDFEFKVDEVKWMKCDNAFLKYNGGRYYSLHRDAYDSHYILLSCDYEKYMYDDSSIVVNYIDCEGEFTASPNTVTVLVNNEYSNNLSTYNKDYFTGGFSDNDIMLDRAKIQEGCKTLDKLVRLEDYQSYISTYPSVKSCQCVDWSVKSFTDIKPYQIICFLLLDEETPSNEFMKKLQEDIKEKQVYSNEVILKAGACIPKSVKVKIKAKSKFVDTLSLTNLVRDSIKVLYQHKSFDQNLIREEIYTNVLSKTNEIYTMEIVEPKENFYPSIGEYFELSNVEVEVE